MSGTEKPRILIANTQAEGRSSLSRDLAGLGYAVRVTSDLSRVLEGASSSQFDLLLLDVDLFDARQNGFDVLRRIVRDHPELPVLAMGAENTVLSSLLAARFGARDYFAKPYSFGQLAGAIAQQLQPAKNSEVRKLSTNSVVIGNSAGMREAVRRIGRAMKSTYPVLFYGGPGSGKSILARTLTENGKDPNWLRITASTIKEDVPGLFQEANDKKIPVFLHRLDRYPKLLTMTLLGVLGNRGTSHEPRIISSYCPMDDVEPAMQELLDHVSVLEIPVPGITDRRDDIAQLASSFLAELSSRDAQFAPDALEWLSLPGRFANMRSLRNFVTKAAQFTDANVINRSHLQELQEGMQKPDDLHVDFQKLAARFLAQDADPEDSLYQTYLQLAELPLLQQVMNMVQGNQVKAAKMLGINRNTLRKKLERLDAHKKP